MAFSYNNYPTYIVDEFFSFLGNIFEGKTGPHIDEVVQDLESFEEVGAVRKFRDRMLRDFTGVQAQ